MSDTKKKASTKSRAVAFGRNYFYQITSIDNDKQNNGVVVDLPWKDEDDDDNAAVSAVCTAQSTVLLNKRNGNSLYQVGTLHGRVYPQWTRIEIPLPVSCLQIAAGRHFCVARCQGGVVLTWGAGHFGQLGISIMETSQNSTTTTTFVPQPVLVERLLPANTGSPVCSVAAGDWHALALTEAGTVWAWGSNRSYQCGQQKTSSSQQQQHPGTVPLPLPISSLAPVPMQQIAAGRSHSCALSGETNKVYCWGNASHGQCGVAPRRGVPGVSANANKPVPGIPASLEMVQIAAAGHHCLSLSKAGRVFCWGDGREGQLGLASVGGGTNNGAIIMQATSTNTTTHVCKPRLVADLDFVAVAAGQEWKLQQQQQQNSSSSAAEALAKIPKIVSVYAAPSYSAAISSSGHVYCWGSNDVGQLGLETPDFLLDEDDDDGNDDSIVRANSSGSSNSSEQPQTRQQHHGMEREIHTRTFDSNHNVLLPVRVQAVDDIRVESLAVGPNHMWCFGKERDENEDVVVGRTLYEVQEEQRLKRLTRGATLRMNALTANRGGGGGAKPPPPPLQDDDKAVATPPVAPAEDFDTTADADTAAKGTTNEQTSVDIERISPPIEPPHQISTSTASGSEQGDDNKQNKVTTTAQDTMANDATTAAIIESITASATSNTANNNNTAIVEDPSGRTSSSSSSSSSTTSLGSQEEQLAKVSTTNDVVMPATEPSATTTKPGGEEQCRRLTTQQESSFTRKTAENDEDVSIVVGGGTTSRTTTTPKVKKRRGLIKRISKGLRRRWSSDSNKKQGEMSTLDTEENVAN